MRKIITTLFVIILSLSNSNVVWAQINLQDSLILVDLYNSTNGVYWKNNTNWLSGSVADWNGVTVISNRVTSILLDSNSLSGPLPSSLGNLDQLVNLDLQHNYIYGDMPASLGNLSLLQVLNLDDNMLGGTIPTTFSGLSNLVTLDLGTCNFIGSTFPLVVGNLSKLENLNMGNFWIADNTLPDTLRNLTKLHTLNLAKMGFVGTVPDWVGDFHDLTSLILSSNFFNGLSPLLWNLTNLTHLDISFDNLNISIPYEIGNLSKLQFLDFRASGLHGSIPSSIGNLV